MDLLQRTVDSFLQHNTYPISQSILIEDSCDDAVHDHVLSAFGDPFDTIIFNKPKLGQIKSIDAAYEKVETPYVFHCEDDWLFLRPGFIEDSFSVLETDRQMITVWLRDRNVYAAERIGSDKYVTDQGVSYRTVNAEADPDWHGFTFNPGLRRHADYLRIKPFDDVGHEYEINKRYFELGYRAAILDNPATEHIGWRRSVRKVEMGVPQRKSRTWLQKRLGLNKCKKRD